MSQNQNLGTLGQSLSVNTAANTITVNAQFIVGNSVSNVVVNSTSVSINGVTINSTGFSGNLTVTSALIANGTAGLSSQVLTTNGTGVYWSSAGVNTNATYVWSNAHTFNGVVTLAQTAVGTVNNSLYLNGTSLSSLQTQITSNASAAYTNAVSYTDGKILTANSAITGNAATAYTNATIFASNASNVNTGTLAQTILPYRMDQNVRTTDNVSFGTVNAASYTVGTAFTANATVVNAVSYYAGTTLIGNTTGPYGKTEATLNVNSALTSNNSSYLGGTVASGYQTTAGLSANVASLTSNNSAYLGGTAAASYLLSSTASSTYLPLAGGTMTGALTVNSTTDQIITLNSTDNGWDYIGFAQSSTRKSYFGIDNSGNPVWGTDSGYLYTTGNYLSVASSCRSPIFYDSDNTGYYVDPASTSYCNNIQVAGSFIVGSGGTWTNGSLYSDSNWGMLQRATQASPAIAQFAWYESSGSTQLLAIDTSYNLVTPYAFRQTGVPFHEMTNTIAANYTITTNYNAMTIGPVTINTGVSVTIPTGSKWVVL